MTTLRARPQGVLLMTYGSPSSLDDVERYVSAIRGGRPAEPTLVPEFRRRYAVIGGSPLVAITRRQAESLEARFGGDVVVRAAMRFSEPTIETVLGELAGLGVDRAVGIVMSPQYSPLLMGGYGRALDAAAAVVGTTAPSVEIAGAWYREPSFVEAMASHVRDRLVEIAGVEGSEPAVLLTAHSLPRRVADAEPEYLAQLRESADLIAAGAGLDPDRWRFCWQSAGHEPGEWMSPDFADLMPELRSRGFRSVLVAPIQFLADHLEILYDVDVGARQQAEAAGLLFHRIESLNVDARFIDALEAVVREELAIPAR